MRICHVITGLPVGGAQTVLHQLIQHQIAKGWTVAVCSLTEIGEVGERLQQLGVAVHALGMSRHWPNPVDLLRLRNWLKAQRPDIAQTWLYHGDLLGGVAARLAGVPNVFWNLRQTDLHPQGSRRSTILVAKLCAALSRRIPDKIVCCAEAARTLHAQIGYDATRMVVIGNGVDTSIFQPNSASAKAVRTELGVSADAKVVGLVARYHPQKDHKSFIEAAGRVQSRIPDAVFVMCGEDVTSDNDELAAMIKHMPRPDQVRLLGIRADLPALYSAFDMCVSSSAFGEGFSNIIIEAMACETPCAVTNVGDSWTIVGDTGWQVPRRDPPALAEAMFDALLAPGDLARRGAAARERVIKHYTPDSVFAAYDTLYSH